MKVFLGTFVIVLGITSATIMLGLAALVIVLALVWPLNAQMTADITMDPAESQRFLLQARPSMAFVNPPTEYKATADTFYAERLSDAEIKELTAAHDALAKVEWKIKSARGDRGTLNVYHGGLTADCIPRHYYAVQIKENWALVTVTKWEPCSATIAVKP